jgi:nicotinamide phosphoribosyltransferase
VDVVEALGEQFGYTVNSKGYKVLPACVRVIQGDGITIESLPVILENLMARGWSADNIAFGMGGGLLQLVNRDLLRFAMKCSAAEINGEWVDVYKDPVSDPGKRSKRGRVTLWTSDGEFETAVAAPGRWTDRGMGWTDALVTVWRDGHLLVDVTFDEVRARSHR